MHQTIAQSIDRFHVTSWRPCWCTRIIDFLSVGNLSLLHANSAQTFCTVLYANMAIGHILIFLTTFIQSFYRTPRAFKFNKELLVQVENVSKEIKEVFNTYEVLVEQCRKRFGSSVAEQQCKRKKKRNGKELKRKAENSKEQVHVPTCSEKEPNKEKEERSVIDEWSTEEEIEN